MKNASISVCKHACLEENNRLFIKVTESSMETVLLWSTCVITHVQMMQEIMCSSDA